MLTAHEDIPPTIGIATYDLNDNLLRLHLRVALDGTLLDRLTTAGFEPATEGDHLVATAGEEGREILLVELCGGIDDAETGIRGMWTPFA